MTDDNINLRIIISSTKPHQARLFAYIEHMLATRDNVSVWARNAMIAASIEGLCSSTDSPGAIIGQ